MRSLAVIAAFVATVSLAVAANAAETLDSASFKSVVAEGDDVSFVKFYAPWCGHCKRLAPVWEQLGDELHGQVNIAKVDVTENRAVGKRFSINGFPTLIYISPQKGKMAKYGGKRTLENLKKFATSDGANAEFTEIPGMPGLA